MATRHAWNDDERKDAIDPSLTWEAFHARYPDITFGGWRFQKWEYAKLQKPAESDGPEHPAWEDDDHPATPEDEDAYFRKYEALEAERRATWPEPRERLAVVLPEGGPSLIFFTGDWHLGAHACMYQELRRDLAMLRDLPGVYGIGMGDYTNNAKLDSANHAELYEGGETDPMKQKRHALAVARGLGWLGWIEGNHDRWDRQKGGVDPFDAMCQELGTRNFGHGATLEITLGDQVYVVGVRHQYPGNSGVNTSNNLRRYLESIAALSPDAVCVAHTHTLDLHQQQKYGIAHPYALLRSGAYQGRGDYAEQKVGAWGQSGIPSIILDDRRHDVLPFYGTQLDHAVAYFRHLRAEYAASVA